MVCTLTGDSIVFQSEHHRRVVDDLKARAKLLQDSLSLIMDDLKEMLNPLFGHKNLSNLLR